MIMTNSTNELHKHLLEVIEHKDQLIEKQNEMIAKLLNENAEKENMINELMKEHL